MNANSKLVRLTCTKLAAKEGFLLLSINNQNITADCAEHLQQCATAGFCCIYKTIEIDLGSFNFKSMKEYFDIKCILQANSNLTISKPIYKLCI